jgi:hypothetical protein
VETTTNRFFSGFAATRARLAMLAATFVAAMVGVVTPAQAALQNPLTVSAQSGTLTAGTAGGATYTVTVNRNFGSPATPTMAVTGLPAGASSSFGTPSAWTGNFLSESRTYPLTITTTAAVAAGATAFTVQASAPFNTTRSGTGTLTVNPAVVAQPQTITFGALAGKTFGDVPFNVSATASSGLTVSFAAAGNCSVAGALVSVTGAGSCTITASQAGNASWLAATPVAQTFAIAQASQTITFNALADKLVGDPAFMVSATSTSLLPVSFAATGDCTVAGNTVTLTTPTAPPGTCTVTASQTGNANFTAATAVPQTFAINAFTGTELYAVSGTASLPGQSVTVWGYNSTGAAATQPGGDPIIVNQGDTVTIRLHNQLAVPTALLFQGQAMVPDTTGVAPGASKVYTFVASQPGTYLYEAGLLHNAEYQVAMGLHGALIVRPTGAPLQAYADPATAFDDEAALVLSEIDPALNNAADPAAFDMRNFAPRYFTINGQVHPNTAAIPSVPGHKVLLRYVNAGVQHHSMAVLGLRQNVVAKDASLLPTGAQSVSAETLAAGQTGDAIATVSATAADGSKFAVYDGNLKLYNNGDGSNFGGMLTFVAVTGTPGGDTVGPATSGVSVNPFGLVNATVSDVGRGDSNVTAAEYYLDTTGANGSGLPMTTTDAAGPTRAFVSVAAVSGNHTVYVHGMDAAGNWGPYQFAVTNADTTGPITSALVLAPNPSTGAVDVTLSGTANDTTTGGSNIAAAEYQIDGGTAVAMTVGTPGQPPAKVASISATIPAATVGALTTGTHIVSVRSRDSAPTANWGSPVTVNLVVNQGSGPVTSNVVATRNPNNGALPLTTGQPVVRVTATVSCATSCLNVGGAEGFIDTVGGNGTGFPFLPSDGTWNGTSESVTVDIPLATIAALSNGNHTIYVHGKEAVGVWGAVNSTILVIDKTAPTVTVTPVANTVAFGASVTLNLATDGTGTAVTGGQYWVDGSATPPASPTAFTGTSISVSGLAAGAHTVYVRVQDAASNWSTVSSTTVYVVQAVADAKQFNASTTSGTQTQSYNSNGTSLLANDFPPSTGNPTGSAALATAPVRVAGTGTAVMSLTCSSGTAAPAVGGSTICTNGRFTVNLPNPGINGNSTAAQNARAAARRGTYTFTYTDTYNNVTSTPVTVTITVN